ncbi:MAG: hypothetical protein H6717_33390 [Polyangiaceae bacterium]|nr:hypothetical protein [Polyangiaceae bacterium]
MSLRRISPLLFTLGIAAACSSGDPASPTSVSRQALKGPSEALLALQASLDKSAAAVLAQMDAKERARLVNGLAWYDDDPRELTAARGTRGQVTHASARYLAYDVAPKLPQKPSIDRAKAAIADGGIVRALAGLGPNDDLEIVDSRGQAGKGQRYLVEQRYAGTRVYEAGAAFDLDAQGRLTRFDGWLLPTPKPPTKNLISSKVALAAALAHVKSLGAPWTLGSIKALETELVVAHRQLSDDDRYAWRFLLSVPNAPSALREVVINRSDKSVIESTDEVKYLNANDQILLASGTIGGTGHVTTTVLWRGDEDCPNTSAYPVGSSPFERDLDEAKAALCETEQVFQTYGPEWGVSDPRGWMDAGDPGVQLGIGADPLLSVAMNSGGRLVFANGVARAEVVGHEVFHSTEGLFHLGGGQEAGAISEHMCDAFGMLLERRFAHRQEDACLLNDDPDSEAAIALQDQSTLSPIQPFRPCAAEMLPRPWRNACDPTADNGGWCEGADSYRNQAFSKYDAYGDTSGRSSGNVKSHTNLGIGNHVVMSLLGVSGGSPHVVHGVGDHDMTRLLLGTIAGLGSQSDWSSYGETMIQAAISMAGGTALSTVEREARVALGNADIWSMPKPIMPRTGGAPTLPAPPVTQRPAVATVALTGDLAGRERTFVFYRPSEFSSSIQYVWRDDVAGDATATPSEGWTGPCTMDGVTTNGSPAAAGSDQAVFLAWGEPTATAGESRLRGKALTGEDASSVTSGCGFSWRDDDPLQERILKGSPAIAFWGASENLTICDVLKQDFPGLSFPFRSVAAMGIYVPDCIDVAERIPNLPHDFWPGIGIDIFDLLKKTLDGKPSLGLPQPGDPWAPRLPDYDPGFMARINLVSQLAGDKDAQSAYVKLPGELGKRFSEAFNRYGTANSHGIEAIVDQNTAFKNGDWPEGTVQAISLRFFDDVLVVAFRDKDDNLRSTTWTDIAPTEDVAKLHAGVTTDPALTQAKALTADDDGHRIEANFLYAVYGRSQTVDGTPRPRLSYRVATTFDPDVGGLRDFSFSSERALDDTVETVGRRRKRDYRFIRSNQAPVAAGADKQLHVFTIERSGSSETPDDTVVGDASPMVDRVRYTVFRVNWDGKLKPLSERPVVLSRTRLARNVSGGQAGAAIASTARRRLRWFYPNGESLDVRTEGEQ